jgi:hypothetical protein
MKRVGALPTNESIKATVKLLGCFVLFTLVYVVVGVLVGVTRGPWAGLAAAVGSPVCGYAAARLVERVKRIGGLVAGARVIRRRRAVLAGVLADRAAVVGAAHTALAPDRQTDGDGADRLCGAPRADRTDITDRSLG